MILGPLPKLSDKQIKKSLIAFEENQRKRKLEDLKPSNPSRLHRAFHGESLYKLFIEWMESF